MSDVYNTEFWNELVGCQLSSIEFVQDYLQLKFDGPTINVTNPLTVNDNKSEITSWNKGFRDLLCNQITKIVKDVTFEPGKALTIYFIDDSRISVSLISEDYSSPEAIYAHGFKNDDWFSE